MFVCFLPDSAHSSTVVPVAAYFFFFFRPCVIVSSDADNQRRIDPLFFFFMFDSLSSVEGGGRATALLHRKNSHGRRSELKSPQLFPSVMAVATAIAAAGANIVLVAVPFQRV
jgi:hypothetical protein